MKRLLPTLLALGLSAVVGTAQAYTAVAFSASTNKFGGSKNAASKQEASNEAIANCKRNGGGDDCSVFKISDSLGFASLHMACAGGSCGVTATTGRATQEEAHAMAKQDCEKQFGVRCKPIAEWEEKNGARPGSEQTEKTTTKPPSQAEIQKAIATLAESSMAKPADRTAVDIIVRAIKSKQLTEDGELINSFIREGTDEIWTATSEHWKYPSKSCLKFTIDLANKTPVVRNIEIERLRLTMPPSVSQDQLGGLAEPMVAISFVRKVSDCVHAKPLASPAAFGKDMPPSSQSALTDKQNEEVNNFAIGIEAIRLAAKSCPGWTKQLKAKVEPLIENGTRGMVAMGIPEKAVFAQTSQAQAKLAKAVNDKGLGWFCSELNETSKKQVGEFQAK